jgi:DNA-binding MarR family transcriptional regulator
MDDDNPLADRLGPLLGRAHDTHRRQVADALAPLGLQPKWFGALVVLAADGPMTQRELGDRQGVDRTTTVAVVDGLEDAGLVARVRNDRDRRAYALAITAAGRRRMRRAEAVIATAEDAFLADLTARERATLLSLLRRLPT